MSAPQPGSGVVELGLNPHIPNVARMYDYMLYGKNNLGADRALVDQLPKGARLAAWHNREFLGRAVAQVIRELTLNQLIDIGAGFPTQENVHEIAQRVSPTARVAYVDNDVVVACHARALLATDNATIFVRGDLHRISTLLREQEVRELISWDKPIVIVMAAVLHFVASEHNPAAIIDTLWSMLPPGSAIIFTHACTDGVSSADVALMTELYQQSNAPLYARSKQEIIQLFGGSWMWLDPSSKLADDERPDQPRLVSDGLVPVQMWRPHSDALLEEAVDVFIGGVAVRHEPGETAA
ncbi:SAM-dependent methyltransferase [Nonomuraea sp. NPDC004702]